MDYTSVATKHRAEHLSRSAAAAAHASYYAHPSLHLHTYLRSKSQVVSNADPSGAGNGNGNGKGAVEAPGQVLDAMNEPYAAPSMLGHPGAEAKEAQEQVGTAGTRQDEGEKSTAGTPSGLDKGVLDAHGEAREALASPGPSADEVERYKRTQGDWDGHALADEARDGYPNGYANGIEKREGEGAGHGEANGLAVPMDGTAEERQGMQWHPSVRERMEPHLQMMCGPLLSYYTVKDNIWHGAALVVSADSQVHPPRLPPPGSVYNPAPFLSLTFHAYSPPSEDAPTLADAQLPLLKPQTVSGQSILSFDGGQGPNSFWRFMLEIPLQGVQMTVRYRLNGGAGMEFVVPAVGQNLRWAAHSCNGFSAGVNPDDFKGAYQSGYDPVWEDLLLKHHQKAFHCMVGGGDQIYCDAITREPQLQSWINAPNRKAKLGHPLSDEIIISYSQSLTLSDILPYLQILQYTQIIGSPSVADVEKKTAVDRFYFNHYCKIFRSNAFARANSSVPMVNMLDDHDLIDGFGTYDDETQAAPIMSFVGSRGYFWFLVFQLFTVDAVDGTDPIPGTHPIKSLIIGAPGAWIPFPGHSILVYLGPKVLLLAIDCRAERKLSRICTPETYAKLFNEVKRYDGIEQLVILLGVPIAYPRMSFLEHFLDLKYNPVNILARHNALGLGGMVNKFNQASELLDDLNDHWCANTHKKERNWLVLECQKLALSTHARITFLSGDVHLAAVGCLMTRKVAGKAALEPENDHRYMLNVITSAIVNTPPPPGAARMVAMLSSHKHRTLHAQSTDEIMIPLFATDTNGRSMKKKFVQPRRNYAAVEYDESMGSLVFDFRVEKAQGAGETVSYTVRAPPPRW